MGFNSGFKGLMRLSTKSLKTKVGNLPVGLLGNEVGGGGGWILKPIFG